MKLIVYNSNSQRSNTRKPAVSFNGASGVIRLNIGLCNALYIAHDTQFSFGQDLDNPTDWYLFLDPQEGMSFKFRDGIGLQASNKGLSQKVLGVFAPDVKTISIPVAKEPVSINGRDCYALITKAVTER